MQKTNSSYPVYSVPERIADGTMHALGVSGAIAGAVMLLVWAVGRVSGEQTLALAVYGTALVLTFVLSAFYHMTPWEALRPALRRLDHAAIYLKIAGTYTPLVFIINDLWSFMILTVVWSIAVYGIVRKLFFWRTPGHSGTLLYLAMGWMSLGLMWSLIPLVPSVTMWMIAAGGFLYTFGVIFYAWESLRFSNAIWHGFVVAASACFYVAIAFGVSSGVV